MDLFLQIREKKMVSNYHGEKTGKFVIFYVKIRNIFVLVSIGFRKKIKVLKILH